MQLLQAARGVQIPDASDDACEPEGMEDFLATRRDSRNPVEPYPTLADAATGQVRLHTMCCP